MLEVWNFKIFLVILEIYWNFAIPTTCVHMIGCNLRHISRHLVIVV